MDIDLGILEVTMHLVEKNKTKTLSILLKKKKNNP